MKRTTPRESKRSAAFSSEVDTGSREENASKSPRGVFRYASCSRLASAAAMKAKVGLGIGAAVHPGGVHLAIGPFDAGEIGIRAALGADRASLRLDDATHLRELTGEFLAWAFRPGPLQKLRIQHVPVDPL